MLGSFLVIRLKNPYNDAVFSIISSNKTKNMYKLILT